MVRRSQVGFPSGPGGTVGGGMPDVTAQAMTERVGDLQRQGGGGGSKAPIFIAVGILLLGGIGGVAWFTAQKQTTQPVVVTPKNTDNPLKPPDSTAKPP